MSGARGPAPDGVLVIDKPAGLTSHDVVARVRRALGTRRVGHLGTLDPMATGVLPLVVGKATRLASLLSPARKTYDGSIRLGVVTDTYDMTGTVTGDRRDEMAAGALPPPSADAVARAAEEFTGTFPQRPPPYSAKRIKGVRAYRLARRNQPVAPDPVEVTVHALDVLEVTPTHVRCRVVCDSGFYMRALAHDLGAALGCGGCLETLRRERNGAFDLTDAIPLDQLERPDAAGPGRLIPIGDLLPEAPRLTVTPHGAARVRHGNDLTAADIVSSDRAWTDTPLPEGQALARLYDGDGRLLAIARSDAARVLHPAIVVV